MYQEINQFYAGQGWEIVSNHHEDILFPIFAILLILSPVSSPSQPGNYMAGYSGD